MIGLIAHSEKADARRLVREVCDELDRRGAAYVLERETARLIDVETPDDELAVARRSDLLVVMGGDGTILRVVTRVVDALRPVLGINLGSLGFLTCFGPGEVARAVDVILTGDFRLSRRGLLRVELVAENGLAQAFFALNDVTISRGERSKLVKIDVRIDGDLLTTYNADGLVVSHADRLHGLFALGGRADPAARLGRVRDHADLSACAHESLDGGERPVGDRGAARGGGAGGFVNVDGQASVEMRLGDVLRISKIRPRAAAGHAARASVLRGAPPEAQVEREQRMTIDEILHAGDVSLSLRADGKTAAIEEMLGHLRGTRAWGIGRNCAMR